MVVTDQFEVLQADVLLRRFYLLLARYLDHSLIRAEAPQIDQRADGNIHCALSVAADALGHQDNVRHAARDRLWLCAAALIKA
ncbi:hypothetical protein D3C73_989130 [compost metagenome]